MNLNDAPMEPPFYECDFCLKKLTRKSAFEKHNCEKKKRYDLCKTKKGVSAFSDYKYWLQSRGRKVKKLETFINSRYYNSFISFQAFSTEKGIPDKKLYIDYMCKLGIQPEFWKTPEIYEKFISHFDETVSVDDKVKITLKTMNSISIALDRDISEIFDYLYPSEVARLIFERRFSPWVLLLSKKFMSYMHMIDDQSQYIMISSLINSKVWSATFKQHPDDVASVKSIVRELDL